jgi:hypothetical protein
MGPDPMTHLKKSISLLQALLPEGFEKKKRTPFEALGL